MDNSEKSRAQEQVVIPVVEEQLAAGKRAVRTGSVRVDKHVQKRVRRISMPVLQEEVEVRRVPVNREIKEIPRARRKDGVVIIPVVEEQVVVSKRLVLKEEIHLLKRRSQERAVKTVELERETAQVNRLDASGRIVSRERRSVNRRPEPPSVLD